MRVITFYSYKGGVGRTLACTNFGLYLAKTGQRVVLLDLDLEAPGLDSKFSHELAADISSGIIDQLDAFLSESPLPELSAIEVPLPADTVEGGGRLSLIPAGAYAQLDRYHQKLASLDWQTLANSEEGLAFWFDLVDRIQQKFQADYLVIDSRTGLTEIAGLCTQVLPDTVLMLTSTSPESLAGTERIYKRIQSSPIAEKRPGRPSIDLRMIVTRVPRPKDAEELDRYIRSQLSVQVDRLYYLFADSELARTEYLAMNRFADEHPAILDDYIELFMSLNPDGVHPYVGLRLENFRKGITLRSLDENRRLMQELVTLFPTPDVYIEAAHYYRLTKGGEAEAIMNYLRYLDVLPDSKIASDELAELTSSTPIAALLPQRERILKHIRRLQLRPNRPELLKLFMSLADGDRDIASLIRVFENNAAELSSVPARQIYLEALFRLNRFKQIVEVAIDEDERDPTMASVLAQAYVRSGSVDKAISLLQRWPGGGDPLPALHDLREHVPSSRLRNMILSNPQLAEAAMRDRGRPPIGTRGRTAWEWARKLLTGEAN
jgi:MinD-like ATPase involved in chromosome partitioning or flagellar assembly